MKKILALIVVIAFSASCKKTQYQPDDCSSYDFNDCITAEPSVSLASFSFSITDKVKNVPFVVYKGNIEDGNPIFYDTARSEETVYYYLNFDKYSVKAEYKEGGKTIYTVDGGKIQKWNNDICDSVCWNWDSLYLDLRIH